jgi:hypothetical protein
MRKQKIPENTEKMRTGLTGLFHMDRFGRAGVHTGLAVDTHVLVDFCLVILHGDGRCGTFAHAGLAPGTLIVVNDCYQCIHSMRIASEGQTSTQVWQSTHMSLSTLALSFSRAIADAGHSLTQVSHPVHLLSSMTATNSFTPSYMFLLLVKKGVLLRHVSFFWRVRRAVGTEIRMDRENMRRNFAFFNFLY